MNSNQKLEYALSALLLVAFIVIELEVTNDHRWVAFKANLVKRFNQITLPFTKEYQKRKEIESIAKAMGYEPEWLMPLFGGD